jgi:hypothetical protein
MDEIYTINNYIPKLLNVVKDREKQYDAITSVEDIAITSQIKQAEELRTLRTIIRDLELIQGKPNLYSYWNE